MSLSLSMLSPALDLFEQQLQLFVESSEFYAHMALAFGESHDYKTLQPIFTEKRTNVLNLLEVVPSATLNGAYGAFSRDTNKIYLASEFINSATPSAIADVLLEEYGHYIDAQLNPIETLGDEGEIFADLVQGNPINPAAFKEDDTSSININGNWITVEQAAGDLDPSFGGGDGLYRRTGRVSNATVSGVEVQPDGKIVVAGGTNLPSVSEVGSFFLMRIHSDGTTYDPTFGGGDGAVFTSVQDPNRYGGEKALLGGLALQPDGKIVVAGSNSDLVEYISDDYLIADIYVIRYNNDGSLDPSFSFDGIVRTNLDGEETVSSVLLQPDGKILVVGQVKFSSYPEKDHRIFLTRYNSDGSLDISFDSDGIVFTPRFDLQSGSDEETGVSIVLQPDGKILVGATTYNRGDFIFFRYNSDGSVDSSFGPSGNGSVQIDVSNYVDQRTGSFDNLEDLVVQPDGKLLAAGTSGNDNSNLDLTLVRFDNSGKYFDDSFGNNGVVITDLGNDIVYKGVKGLKLQANGKIVVAASLKDGSFVLTRYNNDGTLDTSFGGGDGIEPIPVLPSYDEVLTLQEDGKILVAGTSGNDVYAVARFLGDPVPIFDAAQYGASYADLITGIGYNLDVLTQHYQNSGRFEGRQPDLFDEYRYIASNSDLLNAFGANGAAATYHYITSGYYEGRPTTTFDPARYLLSHADLLNAYGTYIPSASYHYVAYGSQENRNPNLFASDRYIASNSDLIQAFGYNLVAGSEHYLYRVYTGAEIRPISFSPESYLALNSDVAAHPYFGQSLTHATQHYILYGFNDGRSWA